MSSDTTARTVPIIVAQYALRIHPRRTEHWSLAILYSLNEVEIHEVQGMLDTFHYETFRKSTSFLRSITLCGGCHVGNIPWDLLDAVRKALKDVPVVRHDESWDCQTWVVHALRSLRDFGIIFAHVNEARIRQELAEDRERWENGEDAVYERLYVEAN